MIAVIQREALDLDKAGKPPLRPSHFVNWFQINLCWITLDR
jgi:hypothetical protein